MAPMPGKARREEHHRLQKRTDELKHEHDDLSLDRTPFNKADHDAHAAELRKHADDLKDHRERVERKGK